MLSATLGILNSVTNSRKLVSWELRNIPSKIVLVARMLSPASLVFLWATEFLERLCWWHERYSRRAWYLCGLRSALKDCVDGKNAILHTQYPEVSY